MRHFPQLESGCAGQYPLTRTLSIRTAASETPGGERRAAFDAAGSRVRWRMTLTGLTESESAAIEALFAECEGRRRSFMFVDPAANLLAATDDGESTQWERGAGVAVTGGLVGMDGTAEAFRVTNASAGWSGVSQTLGVPETMNYCLSAWVRAGSGGRARLSIGGVEQTVELTGEWRQVWVSGVSGTAPVRFNVAAEPGGAIEVYGPQVEAQIAPSEYKRNRGRGGWYPRARFDCDELNIEAEGPGLYACEAAIVSPWEE